MKISDFNIVSVKASDIEFITNDEDFSGTIGLETVTSSRYSVATNGDNRAKLEMKLDIFPNAKDAPFRISLKIVGIFEWSDSFDKKQLDTFLKINGNAVLYSYARPIVMQLTTFAGFAPLVLPLGNFAEDDKEEC